MNACTEISIPELPLVRQGKVRSVYDLGSSYLFVASDRISAFDCILPDGIPRKGQVLTQLSAWWFDYLREWTPHHRLDSRWNCAPVDLLRQHPWLGGRCMVVRKAEVLPVECVARGFLAGSGWAEYQQTGAVAGQRLRPGYQLGDRLDAPLFTPAHKATTGHDENITFEELASRVGADRAAQLRDVTLTLYREAAKHAASHGILLADTKFEFGLVDGTLTLVDEALTPDSSRYWPQSTWTPGRSPPSFDKQFVRDYLEGLDWNKTPPAPALPADVVARTQEKYLDAFRAITGHPLPDG